MIHDVLVVISESDEGPKLVFIMFYELNILVQSVSPAYCTSMSVFWWYCLLVPPETLTHQCYRSCTHMDGCGVGSQACWVRVKSLTGGFIMWTTFFFSGQSSQKEAFMTSFQTSGRFRGDTTSLCAFCLYGFKWSSRGDVLSSSFGGDSEWNIETIDSQNSILLIFNEIGILIKLCFL